MIMNRVPESSKFIQAGSGLLFRATVSPGRRGLLEASLQPVGKFNGENLRRIPRRCTSGLQLRPPYMQYNRPA